MMEPIPEYNGKPTVYLDQNILDFFIKEGLGTFGHTLKNDFQVVYSDETLKEIKRSKGFEGDFLNLLRELKANHLKLIVEKPNFKITNNATMSERDPFEAYFEYCDNIKNTTEIENSMQQWLLKFSGGRKGESISDIHNEQIAAFSKLMASLLDSSNHLSSEEQIELNSHIQEVTSKYEKSLKQTESIMLESIKDDRNWSGIKDFRSHTGIGPKQLNNIEPPDVLEKIWEELKYLPTYCQENMDIEDFFQLKKNLTYPNEPYFRHQKITSIYNILNTIGYYPDSKIHKERRFIAALSDNSHASIASFSQFLLSNDESFIKKVNAAYEYLKVPTQVFHVQFSYTK